jgi:hypothetical protein
MTAHQLRSRNWFGRNDLDGFVHRSWLKAEGFSDAVFDRRLGCRRLFPNLMVIDD